ncbi:uncharacterized protein M6B38_382695 [Iris pallida]|uniref:Uncharacterized protein n=1 Tax=Iris pallida TaxID=29817 RepID=A0AAX6G6Q4_IRIPA|nr:uncharacterized protein M6B38_382695 [Iris pallida]
MRSLIVIEKVKMCKTVSDIELNFLDLDQGEREEFCVDNHCFSDDEREDGPTESVAVVESKAFWLEQHALLEDALSRPSQTETRIHSDTEEALTRMRSAGTSCACSKELCCRNCTLRDVVDRLRDAGYNSAVCKSKWRRSLDIPSGEHSYADVVAAAKSAKRSPVRVVIELNFREEFEMARASREYNGLVGRLPEVFVGKSERLRSVIRVMCSAAKRCMKENRMHIAPWRKHRYMESKWLSATCDRMSPSLLIPARVPEHERPAARLRASMLTFDLHCTAVEVL